MARPTCYEHTLPPSSVDVVLWAIARRGPITHTDVLRRFEVSVATAYRWARVLEDARQRAQFMDIPRAAPTRAPVAQAEARPQ